MTVHELLKEAIESKGGDGLVLAGNECGCGLDDLCCSDACPDQECEIARVAICALCGNTTYYPLESACEGDVCVWCDGSKE